MAATRNPTPRLVDEMLENGCTHHSDCFTCPFPDCLFERQGIHPQVLGAEGRRARAMELRATGLNGKQIAAEMGVSGGIVSRWLKAPQREEQMRAYCTKCERSVEMAKGDATAYGATPGAVEVKADGECGHPLSFISSAAQWERYKVRAA